MKKVLLLSAMLLIAVLLLSGCAAPEPVDDTPSVDELPSATPEVIITPSPEPSITPRPMTGDVREPEAGATLIEIDPADRPTRPPLVFEPYSDYENSTLGVKFQVPGYWEMRQEPSTADPTVVFMEPDNRILSGHTEAASITVSMAELPTAQTLKEAQSYLDAWLSNFRVEYPSLQTSSQDTNVIMGETGSYVTYWIDMPVEGEEEPLRMRGRCLVVPKDKRLYMIRYLCPADYNSDYLKVFYNIRATMEEI